MKKYLLFLVIFSQTYASFGVEDAVTTDGTRMYYYQLSSNRTVIGVVASDQVRPFPSFNTPAGTNYVGGYYKFADSDNDFNPSINFGNTNAAYGAHFFVVAAAGTTNGTDTVVRVTGTSITDGGTRSTGTVEDLTLDDAGAAGAYYETTNKWLGAVSVAKQSGVDLLCNYAYVKYWDNNNNDFRVIGCDATWFGATNDPSPDILIRHHKATGWTYNAGSKPTPPPAIASMGNDYDGDVKVFANEPGAWKRDDLSTLVDGDGSEGVIIEFVTTVQSPYARGVFILRTKPN